MSKTLMQVSAAVELGAGFALILAPHVIVGLLIGGTLDSPGALAVARLAGAALVTLGLICGFSSRDLGSRAAHGVVVSLAFYNAAAVCVLLYARFGMDLSAIGLWPAIVLHAGLAAWCLACVRQPAV